jgi:site-specific recombinase XerD
MSYEFNRDRHIGWCELRIKATLYPDQLSEEEKKRLFTVDKISEEHLKVLRNYTKFLRSEQERKLTTIVTKLGGLKEFADFIDKPFDEVTKDDTISFIDYKRDNRKKCKEKRGCSKSTIFGYKTTLKSFYKWFYDSDDYPKIVSWMKCVMPKNKLKPKDILTKKEISKIIKATAKGRDRALVHLLYESGSRAGELLNLKIGDVTFDEYGALIDLKGKTGERTVQVVTCVPDLKAWLNSHPYRNDENAPLFMSFSRSNYGDGLSLVTLSSILHSTAKKAGIYPKKKVNPHAFRHARATHLGSKLTEHEQRLFFGWAPDSVMPSRYTHLSHNQVNDKICRLNGIEVKKNVEENPLKIKKCPSCGQANSATNEFCWKCWNPIDVKSINEVRNVKEMVDKRLFEVLMNPQEYSRLRQRMGFGNQIPQEIPI